MVGAEAPGQSVGDLGKERDCAGGGGRAARSARGPVQQIRSIVQYIMRQYTQHFEEDRTEEAAVQQYMFRQYMQYMIRTGIYGQYMQ